jgi:hypothetical protein
VAGAGLQEAHYSSVWSAEACAAKLDRREYPFFAHSQSLGWCFGCLRADLRARTRADGRYAVYQTGAYHRSGAADGDDDPLSAFHRGEADDPFALSLHHTHNRGAKGLRDLFAIAGGGDAQRAEARARPVEPTAGERRSRGVGSHAPSGLAGGEAQLAEARARPPAPATGERAAPVAHGLVVACLALLVVAVRAGGARRRARGFDALEALDFKLEPAAVALAAAESESASDSDSDDSRADGAGATVVAMEASSALALAGGARKAADGLTRNRSGRDRYVVGESCAV